MERLGLARVAYLSRCIPLLFAIVVACGGSGSTPTSEIDAAADATLQDARDELLADAGGDDAQDALADVAGDRAQGPPGDASDADGSLTHCAPDAGMPFNASLQFAGIGRMCDSFLGNVVVNNTGTVPIGPLSTTTLYVPSIGASWSAPGTYPAIGPGGQATITVGNAAPSPCAPLSCPGAVEVEIEIAGAGIPAGTRACGLAQVGGC
jgi:hypothetical protein